MGIPDSVVCVQDIDTGPKFVSDEVIVWLDQGLALKWDLIAGLLAVSGTHLSSSSSSSIPFWVFPV